MSKENKDKEERKSQKLNPKLLIDTILGIQLNIRMNGKKDKVIFYSRSKTYCRSSELESRVASLEPKAIR